MKNNKSNKNYTNYSNKPKKEEVVEEVVELDKNEFDVEEVVEEPKSFIGVVNVDLLNIRSQADPNSDVIGQLVKDDTVEIFGESRDFYILEEGYCMKQFITIND